VNTFFGLLWQRCPVDSKVCFIFQMFVMEMEHWLKSLDIVRP
jgi:purine nucleoside permease